MTIEPLLPRNQPGARRVDDRRVISGIIHVLRVGYRWEDCPPDYGPHTTIYNRFNRWSHRGLWGRIFAALAAQAELPDELSIDSTAVRAHRSAHGGKGGAKIQAIGRSRGGPTTKIHALTDSCGRPVAFTLSPGNRADISEAPAILDKCPAPRRLLANKGYDANTLRDRNRGRHPLHQIAKNVHPLRYRSLPRQKPDRTRLLPTEGLAAHRNKIRQTRHQLRLRRRNRCNYHLVDLIESGA